VARGRPSDWAPPHTCLFAVIWIVAIAYWKLADVEARHQVVAPAE
jgi:hypothetical protein